MSVVETTTFRLRAGADEAAFLTSDRRVQTELVPNQPGFVRRTTARRDGEWVVVTLWASQDDATAFDAAVQGNGVQTEFDGHLEPTSVAVHRYDTLD